MMNDSEMEDFLERGGNGELIQEWRTANHVGKDADQSVYDDVNQGTNVEKGQVEKIEEQEPNKANASGKTVFDSPTPQYSPVRQLMNKYMPSKSPARMGPFEDPDAIDIPTEVAQDQSKVTSVKKKKKGVVIKGVGPDGNKTKFKSKHKNGETKLTAQF